MYLTDCLICQHGDEKDGKSHCQKESTYSYQTQCIQQKALKDYLQREIGEEQVFAAL